VKYKPLRGGSYVQLTQFLVAKKALTNMKNSDNKSMF